MKIGISTACYYPMETEKALALVVEGGALCTEIFINSDCELTPEAVGGMKAILAGGQTSVTSLHPFTSGMEPMFFFGDYPRRLTDGLDSYNRYFQTCALLGCDLVVFHGAFAHHPVDYGRYLEGYGQLHERAKSFGVRIAQENVGRCMSRDPELFRQLRRDLPDAAFVLDIKQTFRGIGSLSDVMDAMGRNIAHIHFSDGREGDDCLPMGRGSVDFPKMMDRLRAVEYSGDAVLELYGHNYTRQSQLWDSVKLMQDYKNKYFGKNF